MRVVRVGDIPAKQDLGATVRVLMKPEDGLANLSITRVELAPGSATQEHRHDTDQVVYVLEGELLLSGSREQHHVAAGELIYIPAGLIHRHEPVGEVALKQLALFVPARSL